ncbi:unnamed protein product [Schistosoma curassoni]|uniref:Uncharacterized protein n=1 Tax=Schistosoma curassoni TaxID=6186 RepID=A0A183KSV7_9TREM|nr:unnamed protein product [Schistosoma curassoni]
MCLSVNNLEILTFYKVNMYIQIKLYWITYLGVLTIGVVVKTSDPSGLISFLGIH